MKKPKEPVASVMVEPHGMVKTETAPVEQQLPADLRDLVDCLVPTLRQCRAYR